MTQENNNERTIVLRIRILYVAAATGELRA
jgi:hypothetical protein